MDMQPLVEARNIFKRFPGVQALNDVSLSCNRGEVHALVGENGAGKSTLIKIIGGALTPDGGEVLLEGRKRLFRSPKEARDAGISVVHQEAALVPFLSVAENVFLGWDRTFLVSQRRLVDKARSLFEELGYDIDPRVPAWQLSVRERKLVQIAQALVRLPKVLILDEPTAVLSYDDTKKLIEMVQYLKSEGLAIIYISHRIEEIFIVADNVTVLKDGKVVANCPIKQVDIDSLITMMVGRELGDLFPPKREFVSNNKVLEVNNLTTKGIVKNLSFTLYEGEILGIGGLKGHGQDELLRALYGAVPIEKGEILIEGKKCTIQRPRDALRHGIVLVTDKRSEEGLFMVLPVRHNIALPNQQGWAKCGWIDHRKETRQIADVVHSLRIQITSVDQPVWQLSGGTKQKVILGRWFVLKPRVWLLIEPTMGIDVGTKREIYFLLRNLAERGSSIVLVTSDMKELVGLCDRVIVMREGKISGEFKGLEITEENILRAALGVTEHVSS